MSDHNITRDPNECPTCLYKPCRCIKGGGGADDENQEKHENSAKNQASSTSVSSYETILSALDIHSSMLILDDLYTHLKTNPTTQEELTGEPNNQEQEDSILGAQASVSVEVESEIKDNANTEQTSENKTSSAPTPTPFGMTS